MSNWYSFHHINNQPESLRKRKEKLFYILGSLLTITFGSWLVLTVLKSEEIHPFSTTDLAISHSPFTGYFSPSVVHWQEEILIWAEDYQLDPLLIATVMQIESCGDPQAISSAGALGLFQVMPFHFQPDEDMLDPQTNARRGLIYLQQSLTKSNGNVRLALAGYNGGHSQIDRNPTHWPAETKRYVYWGSGIYQDSLRNDDNRETLTEWLRAGGRYLCQQAANRLDVP